MNTRLAKKLGLIFTATAMDPSAAYTENPTGDLDVYRALEGKSACWKIPEPAESLKKKKIILSDWSRAYKLYQTETYPEVAYWTELLLQGYELFAWTGELTPINNANQLEDLLKKIQPIHDNDLARKLAMKGYTKDECYLSDYSQTRELLFAWEKICPENIDIFYLKILPLNTISKLSTAEIDTIVASIRDTPEIEILIENLSELLKSGLLKNQKMVSLLSKHKVIISGKYGHHLGASISGHELYEFLSTLPQVTNLTLHLSSLEGDFDLDFNLEKLQRLCMHTDVDKHIVREIYPKLMLRVPNLIELSLKITNTDYPYDSLTKMNFSQLKILRIEAYSISSEDISCVLNHAYNLESVSIETYDGLKEPLHIHADFNQLKELKINHTGTLKADLSELLVRCPNLQILEVDALNYQPKKMKTSSKLHTLHILKIRGHGQKLVIDSPDLSEIIKANPRLKNLTLYSLDLTSFSYPANVLLNELAELSIQNTNISNDQLRDILKSAQNLKALCLYLTPNLTEIILDNEILKSLKIFSSINSKVPAEHILRVLNTTTQLRELTLTNSIFNGNIDLKYQLSSLERLRIDDTNINDKQLAKLLAACPNLKSLDISGCYNLTGEFTSSCHLQQLEVLAISGDSNKSLNIANDKLSTLINSCPNLKNLKMNNHDKITLNLIKSLKYNKLRHLHISYTNATNEHIEVILRHFPNLTTLECERTNTEYETLKRKEKQKGVTVTHGATNKYNKYDSSMPDSHTKADSRPINAQRVFHPKADGFPEPNIYRSSICDGIIITDTSVTLTSQLSYKPQAIKAQNSNEIQLLYATQKHLDNIFLGEVIVDVNRNMTKWVYLPGLSPNDKILNISTDTECELVVEFCQEASTYRARLKEPCQQTVIISYLLKTEFDSRLCLNEAPGEIKSRYPVAPQITKSPIQNNNNKLGVDELIAYCRSFSLEPLEGRFNNTLELINCIIRERKGACRHRSMAFMALAKQAGIKARQISNDIHCFIEVYDEKTKRWQTVGLGGDPMPQLTIEPLPSDRVHASTNDEFTLQLSPDNPFITWNTIPSHANNTHEYCQELLSNANQISGNHRNILCTLGTSQLDTLHENMSRLVQSMQGRCFTITNLDDISQSEIVIDNKTGEFSTQDSPLICFLKSAKEGDVLMIDWSGYKARHVNLNSMMDSANRLLKGVSIPDGVTVLGLLDRNQTMGEDFYSRFPHVSQMPETFTESMTRPLMVKTLTETQSQHPCIHFNDQDWKSILLGRYQIDHNGLYSFKQSNFITLLKEGKSAFVFQNAPWDQPEFKARMIDILTQHRIDINGESIHFDQQLELTNLIASEPLNIGYYRIAAENSIHPKDAYIINRYTMNQLFIKYTCNDQHKLQGKSGVFNERQWETITLVITDSFSHAEWSRILNAANDNLVYLQLYPTADVRLPPEMIHHANAVTAWMSSRAENSVTVSNENVTILVTNDTDYIADTLAIPDKIVIPVSENTTYTDLVERIIITAKDETRLFKHQTSFMAEQLLRHQSIVLNGNLSPQLAKQLEPLFSETPTLIVNGHKFSIQPGQLTLVTNTMPPYRLIPSKQVNVTQEMRWDRLAETYNQVDIDKLKSMCDTFMHETKQPPFEYVALKSMLQQMKTHPTHNPLKPFLRLHINYARLTTIAKKIWNKQPVSTKQQDRRPGDHRLAKVIAVLTHSPYVFITGSSGVGKSSFVQNELAARGWHIHEGFENLSSVIDTAKTTRQSTIIFVDEANLFAPEKFSMLENLFNQQPSLLLDGKMIPLPGNLKFIFAGNFSNFHGRQQHQLFNRHGGVITFKELPDNYLINNIILPTLQKAIPEHNFNDIGGMFLKVYHHINQLLPNQHPLTARNLHMMAMRFKVFAEEMLTTQAACMAVYDEVCGILDQAERRQFAVWIQEQYQVSIKFTKEDLKKKIPAAINQSKNAVFLVTKKRKNALRLFDQSFKVRDMKISIPTLATSGTAGLLIEGSPGIGKSLLAVAYLQSKSYQNAAENDYVPHDSRKTYYHLTTTNPEEMKQQLEKAFHEGAVVIIDELNTLPLEPILNRLLSGRDFAGKTAEKPGFFIIGTQNPITYANRQALSAALSNRFQKIDLKQYDKRDLVDITRNETLVDTYIAAHDYANTKKLEPAPTPRDLFRENDRRSHRRKK